MGINAPPVSLALTEKGIPHEIFVHPGPLRSLEQAAEERGQRPEQIVRSILFRVSQGEYVIVLMAGPGQIAWKALRSYLGQSRLTMASEDEVLEVTGYPTGAVSPFGVRQPRSGAGGLRVLVDPGVFAEGEISIGSGVRGATIIMASEALKHALGEIELVELVGKIT